VFTVSIDFSDLDSLMDMRGVVDKAVHDAAQNLATATHHFISDQAQKKLHTRRKMYLDALHLGEDNGDIVITLDASVRWIEDGMKPHSMLEDLLNSPKAKTGKDGDKYLVVPFELNKRKQDMTPAQRTLLETVRKSLAMVGEKPNRIENGPDGQPKLGLVRKMDIMSLPIKTFNSGQGHGAIGDVRQGPTGIPFLQGVRVYQNKMKGKDGEDKVKRTIMTFRVASEKHMDEANRWEHPGLQAINIFEEAARWAQEQFDSVIGPSLADQITLQLSG
jgi:hypothetical protein